MHPLPPGERPRAFRFGPYEIDLDRRELRKLGLRVKLERQPFEILAALIEQGGEVVSREALRQRLWPGEVAGDQEHRLHKAVNKLRAALCDSAETPRFLETVPRTGYRLLAPLEPLARGPATGPSLSSPAPRFRRAWLFAAVILFFAGAGLVYRLLELRVPGGHGVLVPVPLTGFAGSERSPAFSPDGQEVAFCWEGEAQDNLDIYVTRVEGATRRLTYAAQADSGPAWSPDGRLVAFIRRAGPQKTEIRVVPSGGGPERLLAEVHRALSGRPLAWTRDPRWMVIVDAETAAEPAALFRLSVESGERRRLTTPAGTGGDQSPVLSPDGRALAFTRVTGSEFQAIYLAGLNPEFLPTGTPRPLTDPLRHLDGIAWTGDSRELVFSAGVTPGATFLYRVGAGGQRNVRDIAGVRVAGAQPAIALDGNRMAYVRRNLERASVWRLSFSVPGPPVRLIASTGRDLNVDVSPDGRRLAFVSDRSGSYAVWIANIDGSNPRQITRFDAAGPRWSPDGRRIAVESRTEGESQIHTVDVETGSIRRLTYGRGFNVLPGWSRDGKQIYFSSNRSGRQQIWRMPADGGEALQVTTRGGWHALEDYGRKFIYYSSDSQPPCIRRMLLAGGEEMDVVQAFSGLGNFAVTSGGIYYLVASGPSQATSIHFYQFSDATTRVAARLERPFRNGLSAARDGSWVVYSQTDAQDSDLMLIGNFR